MLDGATDVRGVRGVGESDPDRRHEQGIVQTDGRASSGRTGSGLRVVIAAPNRITRRGLEVMFSELEVISEVGAVENIAHAVEELRGDPPDLFVISSDYVVDERVRFGELALAEGSKVLVILRDSSSDELERAVGVLADAYLVESAVTMQTLRDAVLRTVDGETFLSAPLVPGLLAQLRHKGDGVRVAPVGSKLSAREKQALRLLVDGMSNKQIATQLGISVHGAKRHVAILLAKLNCPNRTQAAALAVREGLCGA